MKYIWKIKKSKVNRNLKLEREYNGLEFLDFTKVFRVKTNGGIKDRLKKEDSHKNILLR